MASRIGNGIQGLRPIKGGGRYRAHAFGQYGSSKAPAIPPGARPQSAISRRLAPAAPANERSRVESRGMEPILRSGPSARSIQRTDLTMPPDNSHSGDFVGKLSQGVLGQTAVTASHPVCRESGGKAATARDSGEWRCCPQTDIRFAARIFETRCFREYAGIWGAIAARACRARRSSQ